MCLYYRILENLTLIISSLILETCVSSILVAEQDSVTADRWHMLSASCSKEKPENYLPTK